MYNRLFNLPEAFHSNTVSQSFSNAHVHIFKPRCPLCHNLLSVVLFFTFSGT